MRSDWEPFDDADVPTITPSKDEPTGDWETPGAGPSRPVVSMLPTSFRTYRLRTVGAAGGAAIRVVGAAPYPQRVVALNRDGPLSIIFLTPSSNELDSAGAAPAGAIRLFNQEPVVFALAPNQALFAAGDGGVAIQFVSVSVSPAIPPSTKKPPIGYGIQPTSFRTFPLNPSGTPNAAIRIVPAANHPQRVVVQAEPLAINVRVTSSPADLETPGAITPSGAFAFDAASGPIILVVAPDQPVFATLDPGSPVIRLSVSVSEINPYALRGATGIPGAGAIE